MATGFQYKRSDKLMNELFIKTGGSPSQVVTVELDLAEASEETRQQIAETLGLPGFVAAGSARGYALRQPEPHIRDYGEPSVIVWGDWLVLDEDLTIANLPAVIAQIAAGLATLPEIKAECKRLHIEWRAKEAAKKEQRKKDEERLTAQREAEEEERQREHEVREAERTVWIAEHGSDFLRRATAAGYDCQRRYVTERAALEHPGAVVDFEDEAEWRSRSCPSEAALDLAERINGEVVWLTSPPRASRDDDAYDYDRFEPCEAVWVKFLGKYLVYTGF